MLVSCSSLKVSYGQREVLKGFDLALEPGEVCGLIGPNGSGKSTALQTIAGLIRPRSGTVTVNGTDIARLSRRDIARELAFLPQQPSAPDEMTVAQLVRQGRFAHVGLFGRYRECDEEAISWALDRTGLKPLSERTLKELSGGERQRVWIAAALAQQAKILLMDEPTTFLDIGYQVEVIELVHALARERNVSVIMAIHDLNQAMAVSDRMVLLRQGEVLFNGRPAALAQTGLIPEAFRVKGRFVPIENGKPPHFDVQWSKLCLPS
ncbi:ABC transporter ATP-binding protein [Roseibium sp. RKSG952]|uniref:ABC transporter ATP-binding protein n=1 Tax=Roseibium sp. RKSG952 TaxID=2529384 RepID=UPI0012BC9108|nr:ABC transporter ATP-binding protein [Roseibium sp. RKSG952]MTH95808.1 ABC transporter ATP-binding protein [Roseibium sp. RKSG952]